MIRLPFPFGRNQAGFTLVEIAVVLVVLGLMAGGGMLAVKSRVEMKMRSDALDYLEEVRTALLVYARENRRLPSADVSGNGLEGGINDRIGYLPYRDLGVAPVDPWGRPLKYWVMYHLNDPSQMQAKMDGWASNNSARPANIPNVCDNYVYGNNFAVPAVVASAGPNKIFDDLVVNGRSYSNDTGASVVRHRPTGDFDDLVVYFGRFVFYDYIMSDFTSTPD